MKNYKTGIFCEKCGSLVSIPLIKNNIECTMCENKTNLKDLKLEYFKAEKNYPSKKKWVEDFQNRNKMETEETKEEKILETIEQKCINSKCDSNLCYYTARQIRSADEGQTIYFNCVKCGERFTLNN